MKNFIKLKDFLLINSRTFNSDNQQNISGVHTCFDLITSLLQNLPLTFTRVQKSNAPDYLIIKSEVNFANKPTILLSGHVDTIFSPGQVENKETEDKIYGAGAQDMKGGVIVICEILQKLHKHNSLNNIIVTLSPEEEIAFPNHQDTIKEIAQEADYVMVFESTLDTEVDAPLNKRSIVIERRGFQQFNINITGPGGHSGVIVNKSDRVNTNLIAAEFVMGLESCADYKRSITLNTGIIKGGQAVNVLASETDIVFETRFITKSDYEYVMNRIDNLILSFKNKYPAVRFDIEKKMFFPSLEVQDNNKEFIEICKSAAAGLSIDLEIEKRAGGSEASLFQFYNPQAKVLDGFGPRGEGQHTVHEFVYKETLMSSVEFGYWVVKGIQG